MRALKFITFIICLYIYLYNPILQILGFGIIKLLLFVAFIYLLRKGFYPRFIGIFRIEIIFTLILVCYTLLIALIENPAGITVPYTHLLWFLEGFIIPTFLILFFREIFQRNSWEALIILVGFIASLVTLFLILNPAYNTYIRKNVIFDTLDTVSQYKWDFRGFSLSESSSYGYGVVQGLVLSVCLFSVRKKLIYLLPIIFLLISIIFNARIGLSVVAVALLLLLISGHIRFFNFCLFATIIYLSFWFFTKSSFFLENETSLNWGLGVFGDTKNLIQGTNDNSNYTALFGRMLFFPSHPMDLIFGNGKNVYLNQDKSSDIGYIIQIFRGGIIYLSIMLSFLWYMFKRNLTIAKNRLLPVLFLLTLLIVNLKGNAFFQSTPFFRLITFYYVFSIFMSKGFINRSINIRKPTKIRKDNKISIQTEF
jgi:hypothetical protein